MCTKATARDKLLWAQMRQLHNKAASRCSVLHRATLISHLTNWSQIKLTNWSWGRQWFRQRPPSTTEEKKKKKRAGGVRWTHSYSGIVRSSVSSSSSMFRCGMAQDWLLRSAVATGAHSLPKYCSASFSPVVPDGRGIFWSAVIPCALCRPRRMQLRLDNLKAVSSVLPTPKW